MGADLNVVLPGRAQIILRSAESKTPNTAIFFIFLQNRGE